MQYGKMYKNFCKIRQKDESRKPNSPKYTVHHIHLRSMGGADTAENKVLLTPKEHYIAHRLFAHSYKKKHPEVCFLLDKFAGGMKGQGSPKLADLNFYVNVIVNAKKSGAKLKQFDDVVTLIKSETLKLLALPVKNKSVIDAALGAMALLK